jgi:hypothetical protein
MHCGVRAPCASVRHLLVEEQGEDMKNKRSYKRLLACLLFAGSIFFTTTSFFAQEKVKAAPCRPIAPEDTASTPAEVRALPYCFPTIPVNCETALFYLDVLAGKVREHRYEYIVVIGRVGKSEKSAKYNQVRLKSFKAHLSNRLSENVKIVTATGDKAQGNAQLEFYIGDNLFNVLTFAHNNVASCAGLG